MRKSLILPLLIFASPAIAQVDSTVPQTKSYRVYCKDSVGSGFFINGDNTFVTARHVVEECGPNDRITIKNKLVKIGEFIINNESKQADISIGRVVNITQNVKSYDLSCKGYLKYGSVVYSYGHPGGQPSDIGLRSKVIRDLFDISGHANDEIILGKYIPGMSGGPVLDASSNVVGVVSWKYDHHNASGFASVVPLCKFLGK